MLRATAVSVKDIATSGKSSKVVDCRATGGAKEHRGVTRGIEGQRARCARGVERGAYLMEGHDENSLHHNERVTNKNRGQARRHMATFAWGFQDERKDVPTYRGFYKIFENSFKSHHYSLTHSHQNHKP